MSPLSNEPQVFESFLYLFRFVILWCVCSSIEQTEQTNFFFFQKPDIVNGNDCGQITIMVNLKPRHSCLQVITVARCGLLFEAKP